MPALKTWQFEMAFVAIVLAAVVAATGGAAVEWIGAAAVLCGFGFASVSDRMTALQSGLVTPTVPCWRWARRYWIGKELLWVAYFVAHGSYAALAGCAVFLGYPFWRSWWLRRRAAREYSW
jgi:hypothetical protein